MPTSFTYDAASQLLSLRSTLAGAPIDAYDYVYDALGNRTQLTDRMGAHTYTYDALSRLTRALHPAAPGLPPEERFTYDPVGNRLTSHPDQLPDACGPPRPWH